MCFFDLKVVLIALKSLPAASTLTYFFPAPHIKPQLEKWIHGTATTNPIPQTVNFSNSTPQTEIDFDPDGPKELLQSTILTSIKIMFTELNQTSNRAEKIPVSFKIFTTTQSNFQISKKIKTHQSATVKNRNLPNQKEKLIEFNAKPIWDLLKW